MANRHGSEHARAFVNSLLAATTVRPVQADENPPQASVESAVWRAGSGHWVCSLPVRRGNAVDGGEDDAHGSPVDPLRRRSALVDVPPSRSAALALLVSMTRANAAGADGVGRRWFSRAAPSAGGTHSIRPLLLIVDEGRLRWFRSDDEGAASCEVLVGPDQAERIEQDLRAATPAVQLHAALVAVAEPDVLFARYPEGSSLLWRDAGAFCVTAQYVAASMGMHSRIAGVARQLDVIDRAIPAFVVGAVALSGRRPLDG